jgi:phosphate-selective porin OprO/OprP
MFRTRCGLVGAVSLAAIFAAESASAQSAPVNGDRIDQLEAQIKALEREIHELKAKSTTAEKAEQTYARSAPAVKAPAQPPSAVAKMSAGNRPSICTPDGLNCIAITSRLHFDVGGYSYRPNSALTVPQNLDSGVNARRARIGVLGTFMGDWNYALIYDFGGSSDGLPPVSGGLTAGFENAYLSYTGLKPMAFEIGYMDLPYTLDEATSSNDIMFMERASSDLIAVNIAAGDFRSAAGIRGNDDRFWAGVYVTGPTAGTTHVFTPTANNSGVVPPVLGTPRMSLHPPRTIPASFPRCSARPASRSRSAPLRASPISSCRTRGIPCMSAATRSSSSRRLEPTP